MNRAYIAGLIDGEGSIGFTKCRNWYIPRVSITNTNLELLEDLRHEFGGHIQKLSARKANWKQGYSWVIQNSAAVEFVANVEKWIRLKDMQAWLLVAWDQVRPGYNGRWDEDRIEAVKMINAQSKWLNWKGMDRPEISPIDEFLAICPCK